MADQSANSLLDTKDEALQYTGSAFQTINGNSVPLEPYDSDTWTAGIEGGTSAGDYSVTATANKIQIGKLVYISFNIDSITENSAGSGPIVITGLPVTPADIQYISLGRYSNLDLPASTVEVSAQIHTDGFIRLVALSDDASIQLIQISAISSGNTDLDLSGTYLAA